MINKSLKVLYSIIQGKSGFQSFGRSSVIKRPYRIWNKDRIHIGKNVFIAENSFFAITKEFKGEIFKPTVKIGNNVSIGGNLVLGCINSVTIEDNVILADRVFISDHVHQYENIKLPIISQKLKGGGKVLIKSGSFIGINSVIMPGIILGKHSVVGASSVVTKSVPDYSVVAGSPAKVIKKYNFNKKRWIKVK